MAHPTLEKWVDECQSAGKYSFVRREAVAESGLSSEAVKKALQRLAARGRIAKAKDYFFVIIPLEYSKAGGPPAPWFIHELMGAMGRPYYVGLLSAAALHGASHHQPQEFQVVTDQPVRPITVGRAKIRFFASKFVKAVAVASVKTPTGPMVVSTPETTVVDLVRFAKVSGQLDHVATVIAELSAKLDARKLLAAVKVISDVPNAQRLGFILDRVRAREQAEHLKCWVDRQEPNFIPLRSYHRGVDGKEDRRWRVRVNQPLEIEA
jgi:predicted transcriptional regulator of viral defense system